MPHNPAWFRHSVVLGVSTAMVSKDKKRSRCHEESAGKITSCALSEKNQILKKNKTLSVPLSVQITFTGNALPMGHGRRRGTTPCATPSSRRWVFVCVSLWNIYIHLKWRLSWVQSVSCWRYGCSCEAAGRRVQNTNAKNINLPRNARRHHLRECAAEGNNGCFDAPPAFNVASLKRFGCRHP